MRKPSCIVAFVVVGLSASNAAFAADFYVVSGAAAGGDGTKSQPFSELAAAETASQPGDTIYVSSLSPANTLKASITLKPGQKLVGLSSDGKAPKTEAQMPRITSAVSETVQINNTNGTYEPTTFIVKLAKDSEVSGLHFAEIKGPALIGANEDVSGTSIHDNLFTGVSPDAQDLIYAIVFGGSTTVTNVQVKDNSFRDGDKLGGVTVQQRGDSAGSYRFQRNHFRDMGGRAYFVHTADSSKATTIILDSDADNIGVGNRNSDSIIPYLLGQSQQTMTVRNFHYKNSDQVGNSSNTALEVFVYGWPRPEADKANWCTACHVDVDIENSVIDHPFTDGVQLSNYGSNTVMNVSIRHSKIIGASPRQVGGAIAMMAQEAQNHGSKLHLMVEDSELSGSSAFAFANTSDSKEGSVAVIDFGGGALGSKGHNKIIGNALGAFKLKQEQVTAKYNWWGGQTPDVNLTGEGSAADTSSPLKSAPKF